MAENTGSDGSLADSIISVIEQGILRAVFQPVVDLHTGEAIGWEALARVGSTDEGFQKWLESATAAGLRTEFELSALHAIADAGPPPDDTLLFVNVSANMLDDPRLFEECQRLGPRVAIDVRGSEVEELGEMTLQLNQLAGAGIHLSIDDTTAASLAMIARVRPSFIKIDAEIVRDIVSDPTPRAVVRAYAAFAELEEIHVIAEGVEHHDQVRVLRDVGVRFAQGHLFGMPSETWTPPAVHRMRPPVILDGAHELGRRLSAAIDMEAAADIACAELRALGLLPSFYIERDGLLRCVAQYGYLQVRDGIPVRSGVMSAAFRSGKSQLVDQPEAPHELLTADGDVVAQFATPIRVDGRAVGVLSVESEEPLARSTVDRIRLVALALEQRLDEVGLAVPDSALHRLVRAEKELSSFVDVDQIDTAAARLACWISTFSSAVLAMPGEDGLLEVRAAQGPLAVDLRALSSETLQGICGTVRNVSSCSSQVADERLPGPANNHLRDAGASALVTVPVRSAEVGDGILLLADHAPVEPDFDTREAIELLARDIARSYDVAVVLADLRDRAAHDTLTGLGNLASFQEALSAIGGRRKSRWAVAMADVDGFKRVNDTYGHLTGDLILRELATAIDNVLRSEDRMYRIGGDEFAAVLHDVDAEGAVEVGERMCEAANAVMGQFGAGLSVGIALPEPYELAADFLDRADKVLYEVKREAPGTARVAHVGDTGDTDH